MKCEGCLCKNCINHNNWCCDCDICENGDMIIFACNHYKEKETVFVGYDELGRPCFELIKTVPEAN